MPETYIIYRKVFEVELGYTKIWKELFYSLTPEEFEEVKPIIETNDFKNYETKTTNPKLLALLQHYTIKRGDISKFDKEYKQLKYKFDKLIKKEQHINLTLTYDFENSIIRKKH